MQCVSAGTHPLARGLKSWAVRTEPTQISTNSLSIDVVLEKFVQGEAIFPLMKTRCVPHRISPNAFVFRFESYLWLRPSLAFRLTTDRSVTVSALRTSAIEPRNPVANSNSAIDFSAVLDSFSAVSDSLVSRLATT